MDGLASSPAELRSETHWDQREEVLFLPLAAEVTKASLVPTATVLCQGKDHVGRKLDEKDALELSLLKTSGGKLPKRDTLELSLLENIWRHWPSGQPGVCYWHLVNKDKGVCSAPKWHMASPTRK